MATEVWVLGTFDVRAVGEAARADLEFFGIDHFRPSFRTNVFLNDPWVDARARPDRPTYAGGFSIFGHQRCVGDEGHCEVPAERRRFDDRPSHPLTPAFKRVVITRALRRAVPDAGEVTVTVVVTCAEALDDTYEDPLLKFEGLGLSLFK